MSSRYQFTDSSGIPSYDDAGVHLLDTETALVQTVDFFTPIVDNPFTFGAIATTNALSDIYAMGASPLTALNICCFPSDAYGVDVLADVIAGGLSVLQQAGVALLGGHTVKDPEFKFGVSVTGTCNPEHILTNRSARPGDILVLTKPLGTGVFTTALKRGFIDDIALEPVVSSMLLLNNGPIDIARDFGIPTLVHTATDITGYGLLGHLSHWVRESDIGLTLYLSQIPFFDGLRELVAQGIVPGGTYANADFAAPYTSGREAISEDLWLSLNDPQTSGGLCLALDASIAAAFCSRMTDAGLQSWVIGEVTRDRPAMITLEL